MQTLRCTIYQPQIRPELTQPKTFPSKTASCFSKAEMSCLTVKDPLLDKEKLHLISSCDPFFNIIAIIIKHSNRWRIFNTFKYEGIKHMQLCWKSSILKVKVCHTNVHYYTPNKIKLYPEMVEIGVVLWFGTTHAILSYWEYSALKEFKMSCCPMPIYNLSCPILNNFRVLMAKKPDENQSLVLNLICNRQVAKI